MMTTNQSMHWAVTAALSLIALATPAAALAQTSGANGTHDPSRIIESDGKFYFCGTGGGCASSPDGLVWSRTGLRISIPPWAAETTGSNGQTKGVWAPDIIFYNNIYYIYYSFCGAEAAPAPCAMGLYTTPTLDSTSAKFKLTEAGKVVNSRKPTTGYQFATIDPAPVLDATGNLWSSWGSGYGKDGSALQIYITRMATTGLPLTSDPSYQPPMMLGYGLETGRIEGSYVHPHGGYYYLFWNSGGCCSGTSSTYTVHVARSQSITGPYTGAKVWYSSNGNINGPGHIGIYSACGVERFTYHYYPSAASVLGENDLTWSSDGWPVPGNQSTTPLVPCGNPGSGGSGAGGNGAGGNGAGGVSGGGMVQGGIGGVFGGMGGAGGAFGLGGSSNGGPANVGGSSGSPSGQSGSPPSGSSGASSSGAGSPSTEFAGGAGASGGDSSSGCGCSLARSERRGLGGALALVLASAAFAKRRRRGGTSATATL